MYPSTRSAPSNMWRAVSQQTRRVQLPADPVAAKLARDFVREVFTAKEIAPRHAAVVEDAELLASELVTNAVRYGTPPIDLELRCDEDCVRMSVHDHGSFPPRMRRMTPDAAGGRGLHLVDLLSDTWGHEIDRHGKTVWLTLSV